MKSAERLQACNGCISACGRASFWTQAMWLMNGMKAMVRMPAPTAVSVSAVILACERAYQWDMVLNLLERGRLDRLLRDQAPEVKEGRTGRQRAAELAMLTAACRACDVADQWRSSLELLPKMLAGSSLEPNVFTFGTAFQICSHGQGQQALRWYQEMRRLSLEPGIISHNQVMRALTSSQLWEKSLDLLAGAEQEALQRSEVTVSSAVKNDLRWAQVIQVLRDARRRSVQSSEIIARSAFTTAARDTTFPWQRASATLAAEMFEGLQPNVFSCAAALKACTAWREVFALYPLLAATKPSRLDELVAFHNMADSCEKSEEVTPGIWSRVLQLLDRDLRENALQADHISSHHLTAAAASGGGWRLAVHMALEQMKDHLDVDGQMIVASKVATGNWQLALALAPDGHFKDLCTALDQISHWPLALQLLMDQTEQRSLPLDRAYDLALSFYLSRA